MSNVGNSTKRLVKSGIKAAYDPIGGTKDSLKVLKDDWSDATGKTAAKERQKEADAESARLREIQFAEMGKLNDEENRRIKKLLLGGRYGTRGYTNSPLFRQAASARSAAPVMSAAGGSSGAAGAAAMRAGGMSATAAAGRLGQFRAMVQG